MPSGFSELERKRIIISLKEAAKKGIEKYGMEKTTVDFLVKEASISKGSFYAFYSAKEFLFYEVFFEAHNEIHHNFELQLNQVDHLTEDVLTTLIYNALTRLDDSMLFKIIVNGDYEWLMRKLPEEYIILLNQEDNILGTSMYDKLPFISDEKKEIYVTAFRLVLMSILHTREIGEKYYKEAVYISIKGIVNQLMMEAQK